MFVKNHYYLVIEGAQATLDDIFDPHITENVNAEVEEVIQV
jgi:hypothetical protein